MTKIAPYGAWESPITATDVARGQVPLGFPAVVGDEVWWQEGRPDEAGRTTIVARSDVSSQPRVLLPAPYNARTRVHEYGGRSYLAVPPAEPTPAGSFDLVFANFADQRLYRASTGGAPTGGAPANGATVDAATTDAATTGGLFEPTPLTPVPPDPAGLRYADFTLSPDGREIWCVREAHDADSRAITRAIVAVPLDGSAASSPEAVRVLVTGADFFAFPAPSPDGTQLAWISWDHPRMPWDGTELRVGPASGTTVAASHLVMGGPEESVLAPVWADDDSLYAISDASGWWNLYQVAATAGAPPRALCPREEEFAGPLWQLGVRYYAVLDDSRLAVLHGASETRLGFLDPVSGELTDAEIGTEYRTFGHSGLDASGATITAVAAGPSTPITVVRTRATARSGAAVTPAVTAEVMRREVTTIDPAYLPIPIHVSLSMTQNDPVVHALVYPPASPVAAAPAGELPPYVVWVHGGPTANTAPVLDLEKAYFTSRGIGVIDVDYGGSSGYGRAYRERLKGQWGVVDVVDSMNAALAVAADGSADRARLGIRGGSAGGWTALAAVTSGVSGGREPVFSAAASYYGVSDLKPFVEITHDFESHYLDGLVGPLPAASDLYDERSPIGHVGPGTCPILLLQGMDDPIVPPPQSDAIASDLAAHGIQYAYLKFPGESHGFRKAETIIAALEAELTFYGQIMGFEPPGVAPVKLEG